MLERRVARAKPLRLRPSCEPIANKARHIFLSALAMYAGLKVWLHAITAAPVVRGIVAIAGALQIVGIAQALRRVFIFGRRKRASGPAVSFRGLAFTPSRFVHHLAQSWYVRDSCSRLRHSFTPSVVPAVAH